MAARGWSAGVGDAGAIRLMTWHPAHFRADDGALIVCVEGDGHSWLTRADPSADPTPTSPMGL